MEVDEFGRKELGEWISALRRVGLGEDFLACTAMGVVSSSSNMDPKKIKIGL